MAARVSTISKRRRYGPSAALGAMAVTVTSPVILISYKAASRPADKSSGDAKTPLHRGPSHPVSRLFRHAPADEELPHGPIRFPLHREPGGPGARRSLRHPGPVACRVRGGDEPQPPVHLRTPRVSRAPGPGAGE